jgi:murein DD-endopeptidase MepM/ murein hydrolase activator NlpD
LPEGHGNIRQYSVPVGLLWISGILTACFVLVNLFLLADYFDTRVDQARLTQLNHENAILSSRFLELDQSIASLRDDYETLVGKEVAIRTIFDLPEIDPEARLLGVGGPTDLDENVLSPATRAAIEVAADVDELLRLAKFEHEKFEEVYSALSDKKTRLDHTPSIMPTTGYLSRGYGYKTDPFTGFKQLHSGIDIANRSGTPIHASADGKIIAAHRAGGLGKMIVIDHGYGYRTRYGHLNQFDVKVGQRVKRGDVIGYMGNTGYSTGPHLHYEVLIKGKSVNPYKYILNRS